MSTMKAVIYDPGVQETMMRFVQEHPRALSSPKGDDVLVRTLAAALNPVDYKLPTFPGMGFLKRGTVVGIDICAEVMEDKGGFHKGDIVYGTTKAGSLAEYTTVSPNAVALKPNSMSNVEAAGLGVAYLSALAMCKATNVQKGSAVAVIGASGGCGAAAVQLAKALGASDVIGISSQKNSDFVKSLGASRVIHYDDYPDNLSKMKEAIPGGSVDAILDTVSSPDDPNYEPISRPWLKPDAKYAALNSPSAFDWVRMLLFPSWLQRRDYKLILLDAKDGKADLQYLGKLITEGTLKPIIHSHHPFTSEGVLEAVREQKSRRARGKIVIDFGAPAKTID